MKSMCLPICRSQQYSVRSEHDVDTVEVLEQCFVVKKFILVFQITGIATQYWSSENEHNLSGSAASMYVNPNFSKTISTLHGLRNCMSQNFEIAHLKIYARLAGDPRSTWCAVV